MRRVVLGAMLAHIQGRGDGPMTATMMTATTTTDTLKLVTQTPDGRDTSNVMTAIAFEAEVHPHLQSLYQWAYRLTHDTDAAYDLVQDTLERGYRKCALFQPGTNMRAWLLRIMRNVWISRHRRVGPAAPTISLDDLDEDALYRRAAHDSRGLSVVETCVVDDMGEGSILGAIETLAPRYRDVVLLADVEGIGYQDIAARLQIPMGSVASRLFRARRLLRGVLREQAHAAGYLTRAS
jgi:RNA polymerase sigma-70 factor, ECF subfamily